MILEKLIRTAVITNFVSCSMLQHLHEQHTHTYACTHTVMNGLDWVGIGCTGLDRLYMGMQYFPSYEKDSDAAVSLKWGVIGSKCFIKFVIA